MTASGRRPRLNSGSPASTSASIRTRAGCSVSARRAGAPCSPSALPLAPRLVLPAPADIAPAKTFRPIYLVDRQVGAFACRRKACSQACHSQHPAAIGEEPVAVAFGAGVEDLHIGIARRGLQPAYLRPA